MTIAFDIDGCWSLDPQLFSDIASMFADDGHTVIIVTGRDQPREKLERLGLFIGTHFEGNHITLYPIIVSGSRFKEHAALDAGYNVDIWIDNEPGTIQPTKILDTTSNDDEL
jgi:hypothetical protein